MERPILFLQSMFILLVASHVVYAGSCKKLTLQQSLCPQYNRTVLMANVSKLEDLLDNYGNVNKDNDAPNGLYKMGLEQIFKNGTAELDTDNGFFFMYFPRQDNMHGRKFNINDSFVFSGRIDYRNDLRSSNCDIVIPKNETVSNSTIMDLLQGNITLNCTQF